MRIAVSIFALIVALSGVACLASGKEGQASDDIRVEAVGIVRPMGDPQQADIDAAQAAALGSILLDQSQKQNTLSPTARRMLKAEVGKMTLGEFQSFFDAQQILYCKKRSGYCEIKVAADLKMSAFQDWASKFNKEPDAPIKKLRIMVIIPEYHVQRPIPDPAGETEVVRSFISEGFRILDQKQVETIRYKDSVKRWKDDPKELIAIAQSWGADILVVGEAFSQDVMNPLRDGMFACRARIEAKVILCDTGEVLASEDGEGGRSDFSEAVAAKAAIRVAAGRLSDKLITDLLLTNVSASAQSRVQIILLGVDFDAKSQILDLLGQMKDAVSDVTETSFIEPREELEVTTSSTSGDIARKLTRIAKNKGMQLKVVEQSNRKCVFQYSPNGASTQSSRQ